MWKNTDHYIEDNKKKFSAGKNILCSVLQVYEAVAGQCFCQFKPLVVTGFHSVVPVNLV